MTEIYFIEESQGLICKNQDGKIIALDDDKIVSELNALQATIDQLITEKKAEPND